jgi:hypothetical protein
MNSFHYCNTEHCVSTGGPRVGTLHIFNLECFSSLHNTMEQSISWETVRSCQVKKFFPFFGTTTFFAAFTRALHLSLSETRPPPPPIPFLKDPFCTNILYAHLLAPYVLHALPVSFFLVLLHEQCFLMSAGHEVPCCVAFLITLFSNILSLRSCLKVIH